MLRAEMARRQVTYADLKTRLAAMGIEETEANLRNKMSRGGFSAVFFIQVLTALGCSSVRIDDA